MTIGQVAARARMHTSAIRYYERAGLLTPPARSSGRRVYQTEVLHQLTIISVYKELGFTLEEIGLLLNDFPSEKAASARWSEMAERKVKEMDNIILKATAVRKTLIAITQCRCTNLEACAKGMTASPRRRAGLQLPMPAAVPRRTKER